MKFKSSLILFASLLALTGCGDTPQEENKLISISIASNPTKCEYEVGEHLDPTGLIIAATGTKETALVAYQGNEDKFTFTPSLEDELKLSDTCVTVTFFEKITSFTISVSEQQDEYETHTLDFSSIDLGDVSQIFGTEDRFKDKILDAANSGLEEGYLEDVSTTENNSVKIEKSDFPSKYENVQGLIIGTSSYDGEITFAFSKKLHSIKIKMQQYYNLFTGYYEGKPYDSAHYDGQRYIEDEADGYYEGYFLIEVNNKEYEGPGETYEYDEDWNLIVTIPEIVEEEFVIDSTSLVISGFESQRARIYEMTFELEK
ncbi:MAG: hypothetical protein IJQ72_05990 [Bacilli bacterium]|nr:hypothetical protein [Bacilli bacterium]